MPKATSSDWSKRIQHQLKKNLAEITSRINQACQRSNRDPSEIRLIAVTKYIPIEIVAILENLNQTDLGENRPQQLIDRSQKLSDKFLWHLIGQLQRNKVRSVLPDVEMLHSIDSLRLLTHVDRIAAEEGLCPRVLLQANVSGEVSKSGFQMDELRAGWEKIVQFKNVKVTGLMTMAPEGAAESVLREIFGGLRLLRDDLNRLSELVPLTDLSMGMSGDYEIAIEEGATLIRLGSSIFAGCETLP